MINFEQPSFNAGLEYFKSNFSHLKLNKDTKALELL